MHSMTLLSALWLWRITFISTGWSVTQTHSKQALTRAPKPQSPQPTAITRQGTHTHLCTHTPVHTHTCLLTLYRLSPVLWKYKREQKFYEEWLIKSWNVNGSLWTTPTTQVRREGKNRSNICLPVDPTVITCWLLSNRDVYLIARV